MKAGATTMSLLSGFDLSRDDLVRLAGAAEATYDDANRSSDEIERSALVAAGWEIVTPAALGLISAYQDGIFFAGESLGARALVLRKGDDYIVSFRGTDGFIDVGDYGRLLTGTYDDMFAPLLQALASQSTTSAKFEFVGHSLGAGAVNQLADVASTAYGGRFSSAKFVAFASPIIKNDSNILNVGFQNDVIYYALAQNVDNPSSADNIYLVTPEYLAGNTAPSIPTSANIYAHSMVGYLATTRALKLSRYTEQMTLDSLILVGRGSAVEVRDVLVTHEYTNSFLLGRDGVSDIITGRSGNDYLEGFGGTDTLRGNSGLDHLDGGSGVDTLYGGNGSDFLIGGSQDDFLYGGTDTGTTDTAVFSASKAYYTISKNADGSIRVAANSPLVTDGVDTLYSIEKFEFAGLTWTLDQLVPTTTTTTTSTPTAQVADTKPPTLISQYPAPGFTVVSRTFRTFEVG
jgi:Ca2+-binding RTX toxin-like protein